MDIRVSVIIAAYNYGRYLDGALDSVLAQTFPNWEAIVVDDGSTDDTSEVIRPYLADPRIRYQRTDHLGAAGARNTGIRNTCGELVAILDADDSWLPTKLERQVELFCRDAGVGVVYAGRAVIDEQGKPEAWREHRFHRGWVLPSLFGNNFVCFSSAVIRRAALDDVGLLDMRCALSEDYDLLLRVAQRYRFDYVDEPLVVYRNRDRAGREERNLLIILEIMRRFLDERGGRAMIDRGTVRRARAEMYTLLALATAQRSRVAALPRYAQALSLSPGRLDAWTGLAKLCLPPAVLRMARRCLR
jgi:glycosyltransferase involved in cell wall biosynthesis